MGKRDKGEEIILKKDKRLQELEKKKNIKGMASAGRFLPPRSVAPRIRGAKLRRQNVAQPPVEVPEEPEEVTDGVSTETAPGELDSDPDSETDLEESGSQLPPQPAPTTPPPALSASKTTQRVIPTLTPITHSPRPIPPMFAGGNAQKGDKEISSTISSRSSRSSTSVYASPTDDLRPGEVEAGIRPSSTSQDPSMVTGTKGLLESGEKYGDDLPVAQNNPPAKGGLNAGAKAGIAVGTIGKISSPRSHTCI